MRAMKKFVGALTILTSLCAAPIQCAEVSQDDCAISPRAIVSDACASYATLDRLNEKIRPAVEDLVINTDFFSHYRIDLSKQCPFWDDSNGMCGNIACAVTTLDNEEDIPEVWRAAELGKLEGPKAKHPSRKKQREQPEKPLDGDLGDDVGESCVVEYDDECDERDYCVPEDESASSKGDYVSLVQNPERFTGYVGDSAKQVWDAVYRENCFQKSSFPHSANLGLSSWPPSGPAAMDFKAVIDSAGRAQQLQQHRQVVPNAPFVAQTGNEVDDECIEKRVFYRIMSGMHAAINTHVGWNFLNRTTGEWYPNVDFYFYRLHKFPERIGNVYFNFALVTRAIAKLGSYLQGPDYVFCTGNRTQDAATRAMVLAVTEKAASVPEMFDESLMFKNGEGPSLKEDFKNRFRNVSRLMDCVGCDKCRMWGKLQTAGYGTALKVLFEFDNDSGEIPTLRRTELVALFNTYSRVSSALNAIGEFRKMVESREEEASRVEAEKGEPGKEKETEKERERVEEKAEADNASEAQPSQPKESHTEDESPRQQEPVPKKEGNNSKGQESTSEIFDHELARVLKAFRLVLKSWMELPVLIWQIMSTEAKRLWEFYIGLPVSPRTWQFRIPRLQDEL